MTIELALLSRVAYRGQEITSPRLRGLLGLLAGDLRRGCSTARLVDGLWPDEQPENPTKALQVLVSRARAQVGAAVIANTSTGYRLALREDEVDTSAVLLSASVSAQHSRAGDHAAALTHAEAGLALWDGDAGDDAAGEDPVSVLRAERAAAYGALVRARALARSRLGRHAEAVEALIELAADRPRDEEILLELLRCEAATIGPAAALARYDDYRRALRDELGTEPGAPLRAAHQQLLRGEAPPVRHSVPHEPNPLLGRAADIVAVTKLLATSRVTSIVGAGGLGKTRLANVVSRRAEQRVVHLVGLAGVTTDDDVVGEVASVLGVGDARRAAAGGRATPDIVAGIVGALGPGPVLLVLDNCEHVIGGAADLVRTLVSMTDDLRVLTTGRAPLNLSSESVYPLPELDLPTTVELFQQRARAARPGADLPADVVTELCRHLDGLPLAVELAAARVRVMSVAEIARRLEDRFALLRGGPRDAPRRHQTLHAVVDWSWNLLEPAGQAAMRALSVFPGGFTEDAARHLLGGGDTPRILEHLVDQSLLKVTDTPSGTRFRMLETVREFSTAHREAAGETDRVVDAFVAWARDFGVARHGAVGEADAFRAVERVRLEHDNLVHALRLGLARADGATVAATAAVLAGLWIIDANYTRLVTLAGETAWILSHLRPGPDLVEVVRTVSTLCAVNTFIAQGPRAVRSLVTLRRLPPAPPDTLIGAMAIVLGNTTGAGASDLSVLRALCDSDEPLVAGIANGVAGYLWEGRGDRESALKAARRTLEVFGAEATPWMRILAHSRIAELCMQVERGDEARRHLSAALRVLEGAGPWYDDTGLRGAMILANLQLGTIGEAERCLDLTAQDSVDNDSYGAREFNLGVRAEIKLLRGETAAGLRLWRRACDPLKDFNHPIFRMEPSGLDPWGLEVQSTCVVAHAHHRRLDLVGELAEELPRKLLTMLTNPPVNPAPYVMDLPICGALLLAVAMADLDRGDRTGDERAKTSGVRLIALAERFHFMRSFQPTMSSARARQAAERAGRSAYADAVSRYADLTHDDLRAAALDALRARDQLTGSRL